MRSSFVMSLLGAAAVAVALVVGCGANDAKPVLSSQGESCTRTADCQSGLTCKANVCYASSVPVGGEGGGTTAVPGPVLGGEGESCQSRRDCADPLACFNQRCTASPVMGEGGAGTTVADLGARGETCRVNGDCSKDLVCVPGASGGVGVCDIKDFGIKPTGKQCGGECEKAEDCCQLPLNTQAIEGVKSCEDIAMAIGTESCATTVVAATKHLCFLQSAYCNCAAKTWTCDENSRCQYTAPCTVAAETTKGCPTYTRLGTAIPTCDVPNKKCQLAAATTGCKTDDECGATSMPVADSLGDTCSDGECTCYAVNHSCYRKCAKDLDCATGSTCDTKTSLCVATGACTNDTQCAARYESLDYKCNAGACARACTSDHDCSGSGHSGTSAFFNGDVCSAAGFCESIASDCSTDDDCNVVGVVPVAAFATSSSVRTFCVARPTGAAGAAVSSAITN